MHDHVTQFPKRLSRRMALKGLAAFVFAVSEWGCAAPAIPSSTPSTPAATLAPGSVIYTYTGQTQVLAVAWSPSGKRVASGSRDTTAQAWDAFTGQHAVIYRGHRDAVTSLCWSPNGQRIASASLDTTVQVWTPQAAHNVSPIMVIAQASPQSRGHLTGSPSLQAQQTRPRRSGMHRPGGSSTPIAGIPLK